MSEEHPKTAAVGELASSELGRAVKCFYVPSPGFLFGLRICLVIERRSISSWFLQLCLCGLAASRVRVASCVVQF